MKILVDGLLIDEKSAGIGRYGCEVIERLAMQDHYDVFFLVQENIKAGRNIIYRNKYSRSLYRILDEQIGLYREYREFDLIHFIDYSAPVLPIRTPFIVTIHDLTYYKYPQTFTLGSRMIKRLIAPNSIRNASRIIADSENTKRDIIDFFPKMEDKIRVIYPGTSKQEKIVDKGSIDRIKKKYEICGKYILYTGTLEPRKNLIRLIEAYYRLVNEKKIEEKLVLAGKKGWIYKDIFAKVVELNLEKRVIFTGYVLEQDKSALYSGAELFVYPSLYEGFGLPPLEAMACGIPVVVSNAASLPEVAGDAGVYINPYEVDSIAQEIYRVLIDQKLKSDLSRKGIEQAQRFSWEKTANDIVEVYREILE